MEERTSVLSFWLYGTVFFQRDISVICPIIVLKLLKQYLLA